MLSTPRRTRPDLHLMSKQRCLFLVSGALFCLLLNTPLSAEAVRPGSARSADRSRCRLVSSNPSEIVVSLQVPPLTVDTVTIEGEIYQDIEMGEWQSTISPGLPKLPVRTELLALPACDGVQVEVESRGSYSLGDCHIRPCDRLVREVLSEGHMGWKRVFDIDREAYSRDEFYPQETVEVAEIFQVRGQKVARLNIYPARYNPRRRELLVETSVEIHIIPQSPRGAVCTPVGPYDSVVEHVLLNYETRLDTHTLIPVLGAPLDGSVAWCSSIQECADHGADYLMMTADRFYFEEDSSSATFTLGQHRADLNGFNVSIVSVDDLGLGGGASPEVMMKAFIDSLYVTQTAEHMSDGHVGYVLLVGAFTDSEGDTLVPVHWEGSQFPAEYGDYPSDNWYVAFDDTGGPYTNPLPWLEIGRLAVLDSIDLGTVAAKIVSYEPLPDTARWTNRLFLTSGSWMTGSDLEVLAETFSELTEIAENAGYDTLLFRGDQQPGGFDLIRENCRVINDGTRFVHYGIHGARCEMDASPAFSTDSVACFTNRDSLCIFFTGACKTASFDSICTSAADTSVSIGAALVNHTEGGAVAFLGPADAGHLRTDFPACVDIFASWIHYGSPFVGDAWFEAKLRWQGRKFRRSYTLIGDPALGVLLRESGTGYCDLGVRDDEIHFDPHPDLAPPVTTVSVPVRNLTPYAVETDSARVYFYSKKTEEDSTGWGIIDSCFVGPIDPWSEDTASVAWTLPGFGAWYDIKAVADPLFDLQEAYESNNIALTSLEIGIVLEGFPMSLPAEPVTSPTLASLRSYGYLNQYIIVCTDDGYVRFVSEGGANAAKYRTRAMPIHAVAVGDLCRDGSTLQVVASGDSVRAIDVFSTIPTKWVLGLPDGGTCRTSATLADLDFDHDHDLEIVVGTVASDSARIVAVDCSEASAEVIWSATLGDTSWIGIPVDPLLLVDLNGSSQGDVVVSTSKGFICALDGTTGRIFTSTRLSQTDSLPSSNPIAADLDIDGNAEIVCASSLLRVFAADTSLTSLASTALNGAQALYISAGNMDLQGDPDVEIVLSSTAGLGVYEYCPGATPYIQARFNRSTSAPVHTMAAIGDVKWAAGPEIVFAAGDTLHIWAADGTPVARKALEGEVASSPCVGDLTGDGFPEVIVGRAGGLDAVRGGGQSRNIEWQMFGSDIRHRSARSVVLSGTLGEDRVVWGRNTVVGSLTVPSQRTLSIEPGTVLEFVPSTAVPRGEMTLTLNGGDLTILEGANASRVRFTSGYFSKARGDWDAVEILASDSIDFKYCDFEYAYQAIRTAHSPEIEYCSFSNCADCGIWADADSTIIRLSSFDSNRCHIWLQGETALVESCTLERQDVCGIFCWLDEGSEIRGNTFTGYESNGWGIEIYQPLGELLVSDNWIEGYVGRGILSDGGYIGSCRIHDNVVRGVTGAGMEFNEGSPPYGEHSGFAVLDSNIVTFCTYGIWSDTPVIHDFPMLGIAPDSSANSITLNEEKNAVNECEGALIPAENNWWGFATCSDPDSIAKYIQGEFDISPCLGEDPHAGVTRRHDLVPAMSLSQNAPNPFTCSTKIRFAVSSSSEVNLSIYDVRGRLVRCLLKGCVPAGDHYEVWDGLSNDGAPVSSGVYFSVLTSANRSLARKLVLLR